MDRAAVRARPRSGSPGCVRGDTGWKGRRRSAALSVLVVPGARAGGRCRAAALPVERPLPLVAGRLLAPVATGCGRFRRPLEVRCCGTQVEQPAPACAPATRHALRDRARRQAGDGQQPRVVFLRPDGSDAASRRACLASRGPRFTAGSPARARRRRYADGVFGAGAEPCARACRRRCPRARAAARRRRRRAASSAGRARGRGGRAAG